jgi:hypothetical protein
MWTSVDSEFKVGIATFHQCHVLWPDLCWIVVQKVDLSIGKFPAIKITDPAVRG